VIRDFLIALAGIVGWESWRMFIKIIRIARARRADRKIIKAIKAMHEGAEITVYPADPKWRESDVFSSEWYERHPEERGMGTVDDK
jgi:hypothetical protein